MTSLISRCAHLRTTGADGLTIPSIRILRAMIEKIVIYIFHETLDVMVDTP